MARLLITGGAGFIGSHTCVVLLEAGHSLIIFDDYSNSSPQVLDRIEALSHQPNALIRVEADLRDSNALDAVFNEQRNKSEPIDAVIHFAGLKAVGESVRDPLRYWSVNAGGSLNLLRSMQTHGCHTIVFSSSATLYGYPEVLPIQESAPIQPINPYGHTKAAVEQMLQDLANSSGAPWRIACLRYFNPVGAHPSGQIGEAPSGIPNNLFPYLCQVAVGQRPKLSVFGGDWPTPDGTCIRDYIHVMDLAEGHRAALDTLLAEPPQVLTLNLGSGQGASVLELIQHFEQATRQKVPYAIIERRPGDAASTVADPSLAAERLGWCTKRSLADICRDGWAWQSANPQGYITSAGA